MEKIDFKKTTRGLYARALELGCEAAGPGHEIYLNDPRRVAASRLKTIVRMPFKRRPAR